MIEGEPLEKIIAGDARALAELQTNYREPMLKIWRRKKRGLCADDLDDDFIHWFLIDWISRPNDSFGNLQKFLRSGSKKRSFLAWWSAIARHRFTDFYREKIRSRFEQKMLDDNYELIDFGDISPAPSEQLWVDQNTAEVLEECFDRVLDEPTHAALRKLGFEIKDGELTSRKGRVARDVLQKAAAIGKILVARGITSDEVRRILPAFVQSLARESG